MDTILIYQNKEVGGNDIVYVDGLLCDDLEVRNQAISCCNTSNAQRLSLPFFSKVRSLFGDNPSKSLQFYLTSDKGIIMTSNFLTKDEAGRNIAFTYYKKSIDRVPYAEKCSFEDACLVAEMECNPVDSKMYEDIINDVKGSKHTLNVILAAVLVFLCLFFLLNNN